MNIQLRSRKPVWILLLLLGGLLHAQGDWEAGVPLNTPRYGATSVVLNGYIYVLGGARNTNLILNTVERYNPQTKSWEDTIVPNFVQPRLDAAAIVFDGKIYLTGGRNSQGDITDEVEIYDPGSNAWSSGERMNRERRGHSAVILNGSICVMGGFREGTDYVDEIEWFDYYGSGEWEKADTDIVSPRSNMFAAAVNNRFYMFGGIAVVPISSAYDATLQAGWSFNWGTLLGLPVARGNGATASAGNLIFIIGGITNSGSTDRFDIYNTQTGQFQNATPFPAARTGMSAVTLDDSIFVIGGYDSNPDQPTAAVEKYPLPIVGISPAEQLPVSFAQINGYPNPFNGTIQLAIDLPAGGVNELTIYDLQGRKLRTLHRGHLGAGRHMFRWNAEDDAGRPAASGVYVAVLKGKQHLRQFRIVYVK